MFCSTIIPTIGRPELSRAVDSVLNQQFTKADFEVIVVNDSGHPLPPADWQQSKQIRVLDTIMRERCVARNTGAAIAKGEYLHFLDDDDWLLPGAMESFWKLMLSGTDAAWLYGAAQLVDRQGRPIIQLHHRMRGNCFIQVMAGEWIPLQTSIIKTKAFFQVGGFHPLVPGVEDIDLCRRIALHLELDYTNEVVACKGMGVEGSVTNHESVPLYSRWAREKILSEPGVFKRMRESTTTSYWHGRFVRAFLTSAVWNLQRKNVFVAFSRGVFGSIAFLLAGCHIFSSSFWEAVFRSYRSFTFQAGHEAANNAAARKAAVENSPTRLQDKIDAGKDVAQ